MRRRDFITLLTGSAAAWPLLAHSQEPTDPVIGFLGPQSPNQEMLAEFHQGLNEWGYFDGRNVTIEYRWTFNQNQRLPALAAELVAHRVALIVTTGGLVVAKAAREATATIPVVFNSGLNPVENGFVASLNRPGGYTTGVSEPTRELIPKRLELLKEMVPKADKIAYLQNDDTTGIGPNEMAQKDVEAAFLKWGRFEPVSDPKTADLIVMVRKGNGRLMDEALPDIRQNSGINPNNREGAMGPPRGSQPDLSADPGRGSSRQYPQAGIGNAEDLFSVFKGGQNTLYATPVWTYAGRDGLSPQTVPAVTAFKKAVAVADKAEAEKH